MLSNLVTIFRVGWGLGLSVFTAIPKTKSKIDFLTLDSLAPIHWGGGQYLRGTSVFDKITSLHD